LSGPARISALIADDHALVRLGMVVVAMAAEGEEAARPRTGYRLRSTPANTG
jgi:hypothetical protein